MRMGLWPLAAAALVFTGASAPAPAAPKLTVERVVLLMRHGVRPPTKAPPMAPGVAADAWPEWPVAPGELTPHGADAIRIVGAFDRAVLAAGLFEAGACPTPGSVAVYSDSDQRTIATGDAWIEGFAPKCAIANDHKPQDEADALFSPIESGTVPFDPARADREIAAHLGAGGLAAVEMQQHNVLATLDRIYCGQKPVASCGVSRGPSRLEPTRPGKKPNFSGALDLGSTAGQILLLEYADGKPMDQVGWGRATAADITAVSALHAVEYGVLARVPYVAAANIAAIAPRLFAALDPTRADAPRVSIIVGHDGNVAALAGLFDLHWQVPGLARDDPSPGGALGFELLRDPAGKPYVRAFYRSQSLEQIRALTPLAVRRAPVITTLSIKGCGATALADACPLEVFRSLAARQLGEFGADVAPQ